MWFDVAFGVRKVGLSTVGYRQYDNTGGDAVARTTTGVVEIGNGAYGADITLNDDAVGIEWDTGDSDVVYAIENINWDIIELWRLQGLDIGNAMTVTPTSRNAGSKVSQTFTGNAETTTTVTRNA